MSTKNPWQIPVDQLAQEWSVDLKSGLTTAEARRRLDQYGRNQLEEQKGEGPFRMFLRQFENFIIWILIFAALVSGFMKEWVDTFAILAIIILNAILGFVQEYRAEKALAALRKMASPFSRVIRDGVQAQVPAGELVPGDLVELEAGDHIPAD